MNQVARVVEAAINGGKTADQIDVAMIETAAQAQLGRTIRISATAVRDALDPVRSVKLRNGIGGPAASSVAAMIKVSQAEISDERSRARRATSEDRGGVGRAGAGGTAAEH